MNMLVLLLVLPLMPWKPEYHSSLAAMSIAYHVQPCPNSPYPAWIQKDGHIHLCPTPGTRWHWLVLHESQHLLASLYLGDNAQLDLFERVAMKALSTGKYPCDEARLKRVRAIGPHELHAELPWITQGNVPPQLAYWYPWFDLNQGPSPMDLIPSERCLVVDMLGSP